MVTSGITPVFSTPTDARLQQLSEPGLQQSPAAELPSAFEAMFVSLLLKTMRQTGTGEGLFPGDSSDALGGLFDEFMGRHIADSGNLGIARMVATYLANRKDEHVVSSE